MLQIISDLQAAVATLQQQVGAATNNATLLKIQRDAAIAENAQLHATITELQSAPQPVGLSDEDRQAVVDATDAVQQSAQALSDSNTVNAPSN
jgi:hypothetical protein